MTQCVSELGTVTCQ